MANNFSLWCQKATEKIRYGPDRLVVSQELMDHLEDHRDALMKQGLTQEEAERKALDAMGSAQEIAPQLGAIHKPHLARFCRLVSIVAVIVIIVELLGFSAYVFVSNSILADDEWHKPVGYVSPVFVNQENKAGRRIYYAKPPQRAHINGYTIYAKHLAIWEYADQNMIYLELAINHWPFVNDLDEGVPFSIYDNNGNTLGRQQDERTSGAMTETYMWRGKYSSDQTVKWIEIRCTRDGEDVVFLHIDVNGGEGV